MVGAILRLRGSQKDMVVEKETEHKLKFFSFQVKSFSQSYCYDHFNIKSHGKPVEKKNT